MTERRLLVVDNDAARRRAMIDDLGAAGYACATVLDADDVAAIVVGISADAPPPYAHAVPVIAVCDDSDAELRLSTAIAGAVQCVTRAGVIDALRRVLAPGAPPLAQQVRRARVDALEALTRNDAAPSADNRCRVRLTRLEQRTGRAPLAPVADGASRLAACTPKQRELLDVIARAGGVANAAGLLGTSRSTIYATLRRVAHRVQLRDSADLLRLVGVEDPARRL